MIEHLPKTLLTKETTVIQSGRDDGGVWIIEVGPIGRPGTALGCNQNKLNQQPVYKTTDHTLQRVKVIKNKGGWWCVQNEEDFNN